MQHTQYLIIGGGPAGIQLSYFFKRVGIEHAIVDQASVPGAFFKEFPRHRKLLSINKVFTGSDDPEKNLRWDWNSLLSDEGQPLLADFTRSYFPDADDLVAYLEAFVRRHEIPVECGFRVQSVSREPNSGHFVVTASNGQVRTCERLVVATGVSRPWSPQFPGVEFCESYTDVSVHPQSFVNQRVLIVGKGNSAFETADNLIATAASIHLVSPRPLRMAWRTHFVGNLRAVNNNVLDTYQLKAQNAILDAEVVEAKQRGREIDVTVAYKHANGETETLTYDRVILCTGFQFDRDVFDDSCRPDVTRCGRLPVMNSQWESENVPDMFFAGTLMQYRDYKRYMSSFIHGFRYNVRALARMLEQRYHSSSWPSRAVRTEASSISDALLQRMNQSSALWQQPGFLADIVSVDVGKTASEYCEELPMDYALEKMMDRGSWLALTLEYGKDKPIDPFHVERIHRRDTKNAAQSAFLHPVLRYFVDGKQIAEHHVLEDLAAEWAEPEHTEPLKEFVKQLLQRQDDSGIRNLATTYPVPAQSGIARPYEALGRAGNE